MFTLACAKCDTTTLGFGGCLMEPFQGETKTVGTGIYIQLQGIYTRKKTRNSC